MREDERVCSVKQLLFDYVRSPSLRHIRDPHSLIKLAQEIVREIDRGNAIWRKWDGQREVLLKSALPCWIPISDLHAFLNQMPGPSLTETDVVQRLKAFEEEEYSSFPRDELKAGCIALYEREKNIGSEFPAIIGALREHVEHEEHRLSREQEERYRKFREQERIGRERRLLSGADCGWTKLPNSKHWYCRANGRTYRLTSTKDRMWNLFRVDTTSDEEQGLLMGKYQQRRDATKAVGIIAYQPESY